MGISTIQSYRGAQIFEAVGLERELIDAHFTGTASRIGGVGLDALAGEALERHARAFPARRRRSCRSAASTPGGATASTTCGTRRRSPWSSRPCALPTATSPARCPATGARRGGARERRLRALPRVRATRSTRTPRARRRCAACCGSRRDGRERRSRSRRSSRRPQIVRRFCTGAMSLGSISREAHETLAIAMNRLGGRSNTGEGGEDPVRFTPRRQRRQAPLGDQAGRLGALRRDDRLPRQRRRAADQDGAGREARRGRPAARPQGRRVHRLDPPHDPRRRADLAAAAPRHLLDRGPQAADLRPALRATPRRRSRSSSSPRSASARSPPASPRPTPTAC